MTTHGVAWSELEEEIEKDPLLIQIKQDLKTKEKVHAGFSIVDAKLVYKGRYVIPKSSTHIPFLLKVYHESPIGGHAGDLKTYSRMTADWYWMGMCKHVAKYVQCCEVCQRQKVSQQCPVGLLQPLPLPSVA